MCAMHDAVLLLPTALTAQGAPKTRVVHGLCRPEALIPLMKGCRRVVVVVKSSQAAAGGLGQSLFERLMGLGAPSAMLQVGQAIAALGVANVRQMPLTRACQQLWVASLPASIP
jgi:hypothetical protein